mmetsp:Transcript_37014/g.87661  ORF Transcript_37014/g.87661 Transcript_37014/m.87661 type:complete len:328 (-) Transcript_37014:3-986(-)
MSTELMFSVASSDQCVSRTPGPASPSSTLSITMAGFNFSRKNETLSLTRSDEMNGNLIAFSLDCSRASLRFSGSRDRIGATECMETSSGSLRILRTLTQELFSVAESEFLDASVTSRRLKAGMTVVPSSTGRKWSFCSGRRRMSLNLVAFMNVFNVSPGLMVNEISSQRSPLAMDAFLKDHRRRSVPSTAASALASFIFALLMPLAKGALQNPGSSTRTTVSGTMLQESAEYPDSEHAIGLWFTARTTAFLSLLSCNPRSLAMPSPRALKAAKSNAASAKSSTGATASGLTPSSGPLDCFSLLTVLGAITQFACTQDVSVGEPVKWP